jgi:excisionase family DNA binding protein
MPSVHTETEARLMTSARIVVVHGPVTPELALTLTKTGLTVVAAGADTTIYGGPQEPPAPPTPTRSPAVEPALLTIPEAAAQLGVGRSSIYRLIDGGQLEVVHVGRSVRVPAEAVGDLVDRLRRRPRRRPHNEGEVGRSAVVESHGEESSLPLAPPALQLSEHV